MAAYERFYRGDIAAEYVRDRGLQAQRLDAGSGDAALTRSLPPASGWVSSPRLVWRSRRGRVESTVGLELDPPSCSPRLTSSSRR